MRQESKWFELQPPPNRPSTSSLLLKSAELVTPVMAASGTALSIGASLYGETEVSYWLLKFSLLTQGTSHLAKEVRSEYFERFSRYEITSDNSIPHYQLLTEEIGEARDLLRPSTQEFKHRHPLLNRRSERF